MDTNLEIIKAAIQKLDDHFSAYLARTESKVASFVNELEQLLPSPDKETLLPSACCKYAMVHTMYPYEIHEPPLEVQKMFKYCCLSFVPFPYANVPLASKRA